ncbi:GrpB family protein [Danxiaibacter flavus]|uniref:GrpB family protein n=1 Tax=Danxiaibacter flavus TaxID=3049108 RepID=A0ABV3ZCD8_9BACT|nr:GrpB family protein [Chitinophagaceae bacterium DXS]
MILPFESYNSKWKEQFDAIKHELDELLGSLQVAIDHIGSTSVEGLSAKPVIDVLVGLKHEDDLNKVPELLAGNNYVYYDKYNTDMPYRRFFILLREKPADLGVPACIGVTDDIPEKLHDHALRIAHIHVIPIASEHWLRHIAFRDYLRVHPEVREEYQALKEKLIKLQWTDGNDYNRGKDPFLKIEEKKAVEWYENKMH